MTTAPPASATRRRPPRHPRRPAADHRRRRRRPRPAPRACRCCGSGPASWSPACSAASASLFYAGLWLVLPAGLAASSAEAPGLESATRGGRRPGRIRRLGDVGPAIALAALGLRRDPRSSRRSLGQGAVFWPVLLGVVGVALLWRQADEAQRERWLDTTGRIDPVRVVLGSGGWAAYARLAAGRRRCVVLALVLFALRGGSVAMARDVTVAALLGVAGIAIVVGPWVYRLASDLTAERAERVRTQERADVAAHLHDSVLQTLALIQKNADDGADRSPGWPAPRSATCARWLYAGRVHRREHPRRARCARAAAAVEDAHGVSVDVVTVGDCDLDEALRPIVAATREAVTNAAKHAGTGRVDVYAEVSPDAVDVFVRDRGRGFDPDDRPRRPARRPPQHHRPDGAPRRHRRGPLGARRGHRGAPAPAPPAPDHDRRTG